MEIDRRVVINNPPHSFSISQLQMTYGLNFPSVPLPYFYQANKMLSGPPLNSSIASSPFSPRPRDDEVEAASDEHTNAISPRHTPQEQHRPRDSEKRQLSTTSGAGGGRPQEEDVEVD